MEVYSRQAKNKNLEADAVEIRMRATRRLYELIEAQRKTIGLNGGRAGRGRPNLPGASNTPPKIDNRPTLLKPE
jgi:hypothetical protein